MLKLLTPLILSTCGGSEGTFSSASENSRPKTPVVWKIIARQPENGPKPALIINNAAQTNSGIDRRMFKPSLAE
mgnify:CR=1 FL=1